MSCGVYVLQFSCSPAYPSIAHSWHHSHRSPCQSATNRLARLLSCRNIRTTSYLLTEIKQQLRPVKDPVGLKVLGVCGASNMGLMGRLASMRVAEQKHNVRLWQIEKSPIAQHCGAQWHQAWFAETRVLWQSENWHMRMIQETLEIALTKQALNQEIGA